MMKVVVFDLDDTLYPERDYVKSGFAAVGQWLFKTHRVSGFFELAMGRFSKGERGNIFNSALDDLGVAYEKEFIMELVSVYREHEPEIELYEDAGWLLEQIPKERKGLITDGYLVAQQNKIKSLGLAENFQYLLCTDSLGRENWKPSPLPYQKVMDVWQDEKCKFIYIGDNPRKDFVTAKKLGWDTVMINRGGGEYCDVDIEDEFRAEREVSSLYELKDLV